MDIPSNTRQQDAAGSSEHSSEQAAKPRHPDSPYQDAYDRLAAAFRNATAPVEPGAPRPEAPPEVKEWAQNSLVGMLFGIVYGGGRQWLNDRAAGPVQPLGGMPSKLHEANYIASIKTQQLLGQLRAAVKGGALVGGLASIFYGTQILSSVARGQRDYRDIMAAGMATGGAFGLLMPGNPMMRMRGAMLGAGLGGLVGFPVGVLQQKIISLLPEEERQKAASASAWGVPIERTPEDSKSSEPPKAPYQPRSHNSTAAVIRQLEASLQDDRGK